MTTTGSGAPLAAPRHLVVVGAAAGMGRWLVDHLLLTRSWERIVLVDTPEAVSSISTIDHPSAVVAAIDHDRLRRIDATNPVVIGGPSTVILLAVPNDSIATVMGWLPSLLAEDAQICVVSPSQASTIGEVALQWARSQVFGLHPLFDSSARSPEGQTFLVVGEAVRDVTGAWLTELIAANGGISDTGSETDHDAIMAYVQTLSHQTLLAFADAVTSSDLNLVNVWEARTPVFETLFGLAARVLAERQQGTIAGIQASMSGDRMAEQLDRSVRRVRDAVAHGSPGDVEGLIEDVRDRFSGSLYETVQATAASAVAATQSKRAELADHRRAQRLVGVRRIGRASMLNVGFIEDVTPVSVTLRKVMIGKKGAATLLEGDGHQNSGRVGAHGSATSTTYALGHIDVVLGAELDNELDLWLTWIKRDVRFLVPESIAGDGVLTIVGGERGIRDARVVSEVVRNGQRSVNIRIWIRADHDVETVVERLRALVQDTYRWPLGLSLPTNATHVHYLGPPGTFSESAAVQARQHVGRHSIFTEPCPDFPEILQAIGDPSNRGRSIGVLPISSSASGLVTRSVRALLDHGGHVVAGGVVDVAVRIDAYIRTDHQLSDLRGARVFSHPQALGQCDAFIKRWGLIATPCPSTADALVLVAQESEPSVALAAAGFDTPPTLKVAEREVDDLSGSITRFLILGDRTAFGAIGADWAPTLRTLWIAESVSALLPMMTSGGPAFDEILTDADGRCLWVTSRINEEDVGIAGARYLGRAPWSPRTPVVRVEADVPRG